MDNVINAIVSILKLSEFYREKELFAAIGIVYKIHSTYVKVCTDKSSRKNRENQ